MEKHRKDLENDPKGLIYESYRIDGITSEECRSIFLDWALSLPEGRETSEALGSLLDRFAADQPDHPMTKVMQAGLEKAGAPRRRGGWRARQKT